jgi:hypothetical protein
VFRNIVFTQPFTLEIGNNNANVVCYVIPALYLMRYCARSIRMYVAEEIAIANERTDASPYFYCFETNARLAPCFQNRKKIHAHFQAMMHQEVALYVSWLKPSHNKMQNAIYHVKKSEVVCIGTRYVSPAPASGGGCRFVCATCHDVVVVVVVGAVMNVIFS